jgi:hypothetical protein
MEGDEDAVVDLMPLITALPCCPNLKTFKLKVDSVPGGPAWLALLDHIMEGRLPEFRDPPFDDFSVGLSDAEASEIYQAVARAFAAGRFLSCEQFWLSRSAAPMTEGDLSRTVESLPERLGELVSLLLRTSAASGAIHQLAGWISPARCPSLEVMIFRCEGPMVDMEALGQVLVQATKLPSLRMLRMRWRHDGTGRLGKTAKRVLQGLATPSAGGWVPT